MESDRNTGLGTARLLATLIYVVPLVVFPIVGRMVKVAVLRDPEALRVLAAVLGVAAVVDYGISLFLEKKMLASARGGGAGAGNTVVTAAVVVAAFGASLAVYGLVLTILGAPGWGAVMYILCATHGLHLIIRWPRYERAIEEGPY